MMRAQAAHVCRFGRLTAPIPSTVSAAIIDIIAVDPGLRGGHRCVSPVQPAPRSPPNGRITVHHRPGILFPDAAALTVSSGGVPGHQRWSHTCSGGEYEYITAPLSCAWTFHLALWAADSYTLTRGPLPMTKTSVLSLDHPSGPGSGPCVPKSEVLFALPFPRAVFI